MPVIGAVVAFFGILSTILGLAANNTAGEDGTGFIVGGVIAIIVGIALIVIGFAVD